MGADVKQSGDAFENSQKYLRWQDRAANQKFFAGEHAQFSKEAADLLMEARIIKTMPDMRRRSCSAGSPPTARRFSCTSKTCTGPTTRASISCRT